MRLTPAFLEALDKQQRPYVPRHAADDDPTGDITAEVTPLASQLGVLSRLRIGRRP